MGYAVKQNVLRYFFQSVRVHKRLRKCTVLNCWMPILRNVLRGYVVEEYPSSNQDLDDYTEAEGDGNDKADKRQDIPPIPPSKRSRQRSSGFNRRPLPYFSINLLFVLV